jgi:hypothetical protein
MNFKVFNREDEIKYGVEVLGFRTNFQFFNSLGREYEQEQNTSEIAGYTSYKKVWKKVVIEPGLRLHYYASLSVANVEPRLGFKWNITTTGVSNWRLALQPEPGGRQQRPRRGQPVLRLPLRTGQPAADLH